MLSSRLAAARFAVTRRAATAAAAATLAAMLPMSAILAGCSAMEQPDPAMLASSVVDSILPAEAELERFQSGLSRPDSLAAGAPSREALVRQFIAALEAGDTLALDALALSRAEFAYLYYPASQYTRDPYRMSPALLWFIMGESGHKGSRRALRRFGGREFGYAGHRCDPELGREGENLLWTGCVLTGADSLGIRLFGTIMEHRGRFKFISFANPL
jgi:hypothetical protein